MKYFTLDDIMKLDPCYDRETIETYMDGRKKISLVDVLDSKASDDDKIWSILRLLDTPKAVEFAQWCADREKDRTWAAYVAYAAARAAACAAARAAAAAAVAATDAAYYAADHTDHTAERQAQIDKLRELIKNES